MNIAEQSNQKCCTFCCLHNFLLIDTHVFVWCLVMPGGRFMALEIEVSSVQNVLMKKTVNNFEKTVDFLARLTILEKLNRFNGMCDNE